MKQEYCVTNLRPRTPIIGRETPGLTMLIFRRIAEKRQKEERRKARWNRMVQLMRTPIRLRWFKRKVYEIHPFTKEPEPPVW